MDNTPVPGLQDVLESKPELSTFASLVHQFGLWDTFIGLPNATILAPSNSAYEILYKIGLNLSAMPADFTVPILEYHLLSGIHDAASFPTHRQSALVRTALAAPNMTQPCPVKITSGEKDQPIIEGGLRFQSGIEEADIPYSGGIIHMLNTSLVAPHNLSATAVVNQLHAFLDIIDTRSLVETLESIHDATLFIPSDRAWELARPRLDRMTPVEQATVVRMHAASGRVVYKEDMYEAEQQLETLTGQKLAMRIDVGGVVHVNGAIVVGFDLIWSSGVIHVIDQVIFPNTSYVPTVYQMWPPLQGFVQQLPDLPVSTPNFLAMAGICLFMLGLVLSMVRLRACTLIPKRGRESPSARNRDWYTQEKL